MRRVRLKLLAAMMAANLVGVAVVLVFIVWVLPGRPITDSTRLAVVNATLGVAFLLLVVPLASLWGEAWMRRARRWLQEGRPPTDREVTAVLRLPMRLFVIHVVVWLFAAGLFALLNGLLDVNLLARVIFTAVLGGLTTSGIVYLLAERITRPLAKAALSIHTVDRPRLPGVTTRTIFGWTIGTAVPLLGIFLAGLFALVDPSATRTQLAITMVSLAALALVLGGWVTFLGARTMSEPIRALRRGIRHIGEGDLDAHVEVSDGSILGLLQAGFNDMAAGLREREQLRDLYGRQVGEDVAREALERGAELGGQECEVAIVFVDIVGSTGIAASRAAEEVVEMLNRFFGVVVDEVHAHGGWVNKFQGDATLAVFGAPSPIEDPAGRALATARALGERLPAEVPDLPAGVGVAWGTAVAGNIGDERRFEFTVIGDPVNEASRLTELAKAERPRVLASADAVDAAGIDEAVRWVISGHADLRGRPRPTRLARPVSTAR